MTRPVVEIAGPEVVRARCADSVPLLGLIPVQGSGRLVGHHGREADSALAEHPRPEELAVRLLDRLSRIPSAAERPRRLLGVSDETRMRAASTGLWALVSLAAVGGVTALVRPSSDARGEPLAAAPAESVSDAWSAASFGERFVVAYLVAGQDSDVDLSAFLAESPDLPASQPPEPLEGPVLAVGVEQVDVGYWAVTVAAGRPGGERFWWVGVARRDGRLVATALPTPVAGPSVGERPALVVEQTEVPPVGDPAVDAFAGWVSAYACGQGDASRYLAPGVSLPPVTPPVCTEARMETWGSVMDDRGRRHVVAEVVLDPGPQARRVSFAAVLTEREGRWEITELLPAPELATAEEGASP